MKTKKESIVVCITPRIGCRGLIEAALDIATREERPLSVVTVLPRVQTAPERARALIALDSLSKTVGVDMTIYYSDRPADVVAAHVWGGGAAQVVTGLPGNGSRGFAERLAMLLSGVPVMTYTGQIMYTLPAGQLKPIQA